MLEPLYYIEGIHTVRNTEFYPRNKYQRIYRLDYFLVEKFSTYYGSKKDLRFLTSSCKIREKLFTIYK